MFLHRMGRAADIESSFRDSEPSTRYAAFLAFSQALLVRDEVGAANVAFQSALAQGIPKYPTLLIEAGEYANQLGSKDVAEKLFETALTYHLTGTLLDRIVRVARFFDPPHQAAGIYAGLTHLRPNVAAFHVGLGGFTLRLGDRAKAYEHFTTALSVAAPGEDSLRALLKHVMQASLRGSLSPLENELLDRFMLKAGDIYHPNMPDLVRRMATKAAVYNAATAHIDPGMISLDDCLARSRQHLRPFEEELNHLLSNTPARPNADIQKVAQAVEKLGTDAQTDLAIWQDCMAFAQSHGSAEALAGGARHTSNLLLAGISFSLRGHPREALLCLTQALTNGPRHWLPLWRAALSASKLGFADISLCFARAVLEKCPEFTYADNVWKHPLGYFAQDEQDILLDAFFDLYPPQHRTFIEVGAFDPRVFSNTRRLLEKGWQGLMIEPSPDAVLRLKADSHPNATVVETAAGSAEGSFTLFEPQWPGLEGGGGVSMIGHATDGTAAQNPFAGRSRISQTIALGTAKPTVVQSRRLDDILAEHWPHDNIDLLCVDVETAEPLVFQGFDLELRRPSLIVVETATLDMKRRFFAAGYRIIMTGPGDIYFALI